MDNKVATKPTFTGAASAPPPELSLGMDSTHDSVLLAAIVESSDDAIVSKTLDGKIISWNGGAARLFGYTAEEAIGKAITLIIPPALRAEERQILEKIRRGERIDHFETTRVTKSGRTVPISLTVSPVRNSRGEIIGASKVARDISVQRENERLLSSEADALAKLNQWSSQLWRTPGLQEGLDEILTAVIELLGADKGTIVLLGEGERMSIAAQRGFQEEFLEPFRTASADFNSAGSRALRFVERIVIEDIEADASCASLCAGARAADYRALIATPLVGGNGKPLGVVTTCFRTVHRPADQDLRRLDLYLRLAGDFIERGKMEQALRNSEAALRDADRRKDEFLALLAHELRNPLAPIRYALATSKKTERTPEQKRQAEAVIERQIAHMSHLLDDLLDVSRITRGTLELKKSRTELISVIGTGIEAARPILDAKRHTLTLDLPNEAVWLDADAVRLAQVFSNLLINAAKYTDPNGHIQLRAARDGGEVVVTIRDDGIGISREMMPRLFTMFSQAGPALERSEGGLGVGLSLVRGLVTLHGGRIEARSEGMHRGSEFVVRLPAGAPSEKPSEAAVDAGPTPAAGLKVVVVDDNRDAAESCAMLLELSGHHVQTAYNGRRALQVVASFRPHAILLDIGLPDITGYELAKQIRANPGGHDAVLIAVTGWGQEADRRRAFDAGFNHHLTKPIEPEKVEWLLQSVAETIDAR
jgi:PAS domain S-box-containing protein